MGCAWQGLCECIRQCPTLILFQGGNVSRRRTGAAEKGAPILGEIFELCLDLDGGTTDIAQPGPGKKILGRFLLVASYP